jgi:hypothetical protein
LVSPAGLIIAAVLSNSVFHPWYLLPYLPGILLLISVGVVAALQRLRRGSVSVGAGVVVWAALVGLANARIWQFQLQYPVEPAKEAATFIGAPQNVRKHVHPGSPSISVRSRHQLHVPTARQVTTAEGLKAAVEEAKRAGVPHYHYECLAGLLVASGDPMAAVLADPQYFKSRKAFLGTNPERCVTIHEAAHNSQIGD